MNSQRETKNITTPHFMTHDAKTSWIQCHRARNTIKKSVQPSLPMFRSAAILQQFSPHGEMIAKGGANPVVCNQSPTLERGVVITWALVCCLLGCNGIALKTDVQIIIANLSSFHINNHLSRRRLSAQRCNHRHPSIPVVVRGTGLLEPVSCRKLGRSRNQHL